MRGASAGADGASGYVTKPVAGQEGFSLYGNGVWSAPPAAGLPTQTSHTGKVLTTDGTNASWTTTPIATSLTAPASTDLTLTAGSGNQGVVIVGTGTGQTATAVNTGGLRSANFGLSTVSGGVSYFGGGIEAKGATAAPYVHISGTNANAVPIIYFTSGLGGGSQQQWSIYTNATGSGEFQIRDNTAAADRMTIAKTTGAATFAGAVTTQGLFYPQQATTAGAPAYVKGAIYFDTTLNKLRVGGATAWETITSV